MELNKAKDRYGLSLVVNEMSYVMNNSEETNQDKEEQREPRLYKVKYKGDTRQCAFLDLIMIYEYKMRLLCRRIERLFHIIFRHQM